MELKKELGALAVFSVGIGAMISSGLFILPAIAFQAAVNSGGSGSSIFWSYLFAGLLMLPALFSQLELSTAIPKAGGTYFFIERILGASAGTAAGFANWFSISLKSAFALVGIGAFAILVFPNITEMQIKMIAVGACLVFMILNIIGTKSSTKAQVVMVIFLLAIIIGFVLIGYRKVDFANFKGISSNMRWGNIFAITGMVFISYGGITKIASMAEEVKNPQKTLPRAMLSAFAIAQILYLLVVLVIVGVLPQTKMLGSLTPVSDAAGAFFASPIAKNIAIVLTAVAAMLAFITTGNAGIMSASRTPMAMSRDGLLPKFFARVNTRTKTPILAIIVTSAFMLSIIIGLNIENLAKVASLFMILLFTMVNLSVIVIRQSKIANYKPTFKAPLYPVLQIFGILAYLFLIFKMGTFTFVIALIFIVLSLVWYFAYARKRVKRKSAFVKMVENITNPELVSSDIDLEEELLNILIERNEIVADRFDEIIRHAPVIDFDKTITRDELFHEVAVRISDKWNLDIKSVELKLQLREQHSSTLIYPGVAVPHAIPHIIIEGEHKFDIVLVRNKFGIKWNDKGEIVYTAFCLIGSKDERNFHLRALMAIAQILQNPDFHAEWMQATNEKELRSVILLTKRQRG